jgi:eukaryotic translation initiation factor 2C
MPVLDWACTFLSKFASRRGRVQPQDLERLAESDMKLLKAVLKGVRVTVSVPANRRLARPIKDLVLNVGNYQFMKGDEETTIKVCPVTLPSGFFFTIYSQDYYEEKYGFRLRYPRVFGICVNVQRKIIVPAEICTIVGGQMFKKVLMPEMMSEVLQHVTKNPRERIEAIERGVNGEVSFLMLGE